jgi:hypothetical protein
VFAERLKRLRKLLGTSARAKISASDQKAWTELFDFRELEFGGTWLLLLKRVAARIDPPDGTTRERSSKQLKQAFRQLASVPGAADRLAEALAAVEREDPSLLPARSGPQRVHRARAQVREVHVENFKAVERMRLDLAPARIDEDSRTLASALVILGENATGKSSLLEAIALTLASDRARKALNLNWRTIPLDPSQMGVDGVSKPALSRIRLTFDTGQTATLTIHGDTATQGGELGNERVAVFAYGAFRRFSGDAPAANSSQHVRNLFDASSLANPEPWLRSLTPKAFEAVVRALRDLLSIEGDFEVIQRTGSSGSCEW